MDPELQILNLLIRSEYTWSDDELADFLSGDCFIDKEKWSEFYNVIGELKEMGMLKEYKDNRGKDIITYTIKGLWFLHVETT